MSRPCASQPNDHASLSLHPYTHLVTTTIVVIVIAIAYASARSSNRSAVSCAYKLCMQAVHRLS